MNYPNIKQLISAFKKEEKLQKKFISKSHKNKIDKEKTIRVFNKKLKLVFKDLQRNAA